MSPSRSSASSDRASSSSTDPTGERLRFPPPRPQSARGRLLSLLPGVRAVRSQRRPYADAWHRANEIALPRTGPLWLVLGDSTAQGIGASSFDRGWVGQLRQLLEKEGTDYRLVNLSQSGARVRDVLAEQLPLAQALGLDPALITVAVGANDIRARRRAGLSVGIERLTASLPPRTVIGTIPGRPQIVEPFNEQIREWASRHDLRVAEAGGAITPPWRGKLAADWFHPSDVGYGLWAEAFASAVPKV